MTSNTSDGPDEVWLLNRGVLVVRPREPYAQWADGLEDDGPRFTDWTNAYLIPEFEMVEESWEWIQDNCSLIFELELQAWHLVPEDWPEDRSWSVFQQWFDLEFIEMAWDLVDAPLSSEAPPSPDGPRLVE